MQTIKLGGKEYTISPILLRDLYALQEDINRMSPSSDNPATDSERIMIMAKVIAAAIGRNHDGFTVDKLFDSVDAGEMDSFVTAYAISLAAAGLVPAGEAEPAKTN